MGMTLDELLAMVRSGEIQLVILRPVDLDNPGSGPVRLKLHCRDASKAVEVIAALSEYQTEIYWLIANNDVQVCMAPDDHRSSYRYTENMENMEKAFTCDACAAIRAVEVMAVPIPPGTQTVNITSQES
jgi:hypothetical protein